MLETEEVNTMPNQDKSISVTEAKSALESLSQIEQDTQQILRPPLWLNVVISGSYGMMTFSWASTRHENLWMLGLIISASVFMLAIFFYLYCNRLQGIKTKLVPTSPSEFKFHILTGLFFGLVFLLTRILSTNDIIWASYLGAALNTAALGYLLHNYSSGDFKLGQHRHG
jgi:hypothetical protein